MLTVNENQHMLELKYRPNNIDECILPAKDKKLFKSITKKGKIPHLILQSNSPGTGKTTVSYALSNEVNAEVLFVNGADCKIDFVRGPLTTFASSLSLDGRPKVIIIDEFDRPGLAEAQKTLRTFMEVYGDNCSVIITCNDITGIHPALVSRARHIVFGKSTPEDEVNMMKEMIMRTKAICESEGAQVEGQEGIRVLAALVKKNFPDFRKTVNELDVFLATNKVIDASLLSVVLEDRASIQDIISALKSKDLLECNKLATKYFADYPTFICQLQETIYPMLSDKMSRIRLNEIIGENNQFHGNAGNVKVHLRYLFTQLVLNIKWD